MSDEEVSGMFLMVKRCMLLLRKAMGRWASTWASMKGATRPVLR